MRKFFAIAAIMLLGSCSRYKDLYTDYAEAKTTMPEASRNVYRIFIDRKGTVYPNTTINRQNLRNNYTLLSKFYSNNNKFFDSVLQQYQILPNRNLCFDSTLSILQEKIIKTHITEINKRSADYKTVTFIIHGINNSIYPKDPSGDTLTNQVYSTVENVILDQGIDSTFFVEIYWDGLHSLKCLDPVKVWRSAQANSYYTGLTLRRIISKIDKSDIILLTHSLGANVASESLFNQVSKISYRAYRFKKFLQTKYTDSAFSTPEQKNIGIAFIVAAMPGYSTFKDYYKRTRASSYTVNDNYSLINGYNPSDKIIGKVFIPPVYYKLFYKLLVYHGFGSTSLGALKSENKAVKKMFLSNYPNSYFDSVNLEKLDINGTVQTSHSFRTYSRNINFKNIIKRLYKR